MTAAASPLGMHQARASTTSSRAEYREAVILVSLVLVSAFGPYVAPEAGLRLEHLVIYPLLVICTARLLFGQQRAMSSATWGLLGLWTASAVWMLTVTLVSAPERRLFDVMAALENQVQPMALIVVLGLLVAPLTSDERVRLLRRAATWVVGLLSVNALLSIASIYVDTAPIVTLFARSDPSGWSVWGRAATMGRYSGVFGQPLEAGVAYSLGLAAWVYLAVQLRVLRWWMWPAVALLAAGGLLSVSKAFVLLGLPMAVVYAVWCAGVRYPGRLARVALGGAVGAALMVSLGGWSGWWYLQRLFDVSQVSSLGLAQFYTANRLGAGDTTVMSMFADAWAHVPLQGFGLGASALLDNGYLEFFYQGGLVALTLYIGVVLSIGGLAWGAIRRSVAEGRLMVLIWLTIVAAGIGSPVLTLGRASVVLWVLLLTAMHVASPGVGSYRLGASDLPEGVRQWSGL
jgi:hypothetical protein